MPRSKNGCRNTCKLGYFFVLFCSYLIAHCTVRHYSQCLCIVRSAVYLRQWLGSLRAVFRDLRTVVLLGSQWKIRFAVFFFFEALHIDISAFICVHGVFGALSACMHSFISLCTLHGWTNLEDSWTGTCQRCITIELWAHSVSCATRGARFNGFRLLLETHIQRTNFVPRMCLRPTPIHRSLVISIPLNIIRSSRAQMRLIQAHHSNGTVDTLCTTSWGGRTAQFYYSYD